MNQHDILYDTLRPEYSFRQLMATTLPTLFVTVHFPAWYIIAFFSSGWWNFWRLIYKFTYWTTYFIFSWSEFSHKGYKYILRWLLFSLLRRTMIGWYLMRWMFNGIFFSQVIHTFQLTFDLKIFSKQLNIVDNMCLQMPLCTSWHHNQ